MDFNFADLKKEAAATAEDVFSHTADAAKQATNATYDLLSGGGGRASTGAQDDNSHTEHYFANEQKDIDFEHVDPQAFVQRMSAGAKEAQEQLDAKFAQHTNDFDDFLTNASKDLHSFGSQLQQDTKQGVHDFMNAERGLFSGAGDINKQTVEVSAPTTVPVIPNKPAEHAVKEADLLNFSVGDAAEKHAPLQPFEEDFETHFAPTAPAAPASKTTTLYDDDLVIGKPSNSASASNKDSDTDSPSLSCNPSPAKKNPVTAALKEQDNDKFISSEDLLGDFKDERTSTPDFQVKPEVTKPAVEVKTTPISVPVTDLDAEEEATSLFSQPKHSQVEEIKETGNTSTTSSATLPIASATAAAAPKPAAVSEPIAAKPLTPTTSNKDSTEVVKPKTAPPVLPKESKPSHQQLDQPKIVSVEEIFYKYGLDAWFKPERLHPRGMPCCNTKNINHNDNYFRPNYRIKALTEKFYARHESFHCDPKLLNSPKVKHYMDLISKQRSNAIKNRSLAPITENQKYGWLIHLVEAPDEIDSSLLYYGRKIDSQIQLMAVIEAETKRNRGEWYR